MTGARQAAGAAPPPAAGLGVAWALADASAAWPQAEPARLLQTWNPEDGAHATRFYRVPGGILAEFPGIARFLLAVDGEAPVQVAPVAEAGERWRAVFEQQVVPLVLSGRGTAIFHGGAVVVDGAAVAFLGPSGRGKSTLTAAFATRGMPFLGDDLLQLSLDADGTAWAQPQPAFVRVWEDSLEHAAPETVTRDHPEHVPKPRLLAGEALLHCAEPMPLRAAYVLGEPDEAVALQPLAGPEALMAWVANAFVLDIRDPATLARVMGDAARLARGVRMGRLAYPRRYEALDAVVAALVDDLRGTDAASP